jgi:hypothetical protein
VSDYVPLLEMACGQLSLTRVLLLGLLAPFAAAEDKAKADPAGSADGLAYDAMLKTEIYTDNATAHNMPPVEGWWDSKICSDTLDPYCVYTNRRLANGRGMVVVSRADEFPKFERLEEHLNRGENKYLQDPLPFTQASSPSNGPSLTATTAIRRGKTLFSFTPVLLVHKSFPAQVPRKRERARLLEAAIAYLPADTQAQFNTQRPRPGDNSGLNPRSVEDILLAHPFELDLGYATYRRQGAEDEDPHDHSRHWANYPEAAALQHDCRPNVATHLDSSFALRATVARRVHPGEALSVSYVDPFQPRDVRSEWVQAHRSAALGPDGKGAAGCGCQACAHGGDAGRMAEGDRRLKEIMVLRGELRNHDSAKVDFALIERFLKLCEEDRLNAKMAEPYELAAVNFNYLGDDKRAKKYAELAVQAGIVEGGVESNDVVAMRIMAKDVKGHYSYRYTLKRRGL